MKAVILCLALLLTMVMAATAQNGGQLHTNEFVSVSNYGYSAGSYKLKITNKQTCAVSFRITLNGKHTTVGPIAAGASLSYDLIAETGDCSVRIQVKPLGRPCMPGQGPDMGQVEAKCMEGPDLIPLPVKFIKLQIIRRQP